MMDDKIFDELCDQFTTSMVNVTQWKSHYHGSVYTTRLMAAIKDARAACDRLELELYRNGELK